MQLRFPKELRELRCKTEEQEEWKLVWLSHLPGFLGKCCLSLVEGKAVLEKLYSHCLVLFCVFLIVFCGLVVFFWELQILHL